MFIGRVLAVTKSPEVIQPSDQITITIMDLPNGSAFSLGIESNITIGDEVVVKTFKILHLG
ncbi:MAG: hypothetical protein STSR0009_22400 [Methanoregula sp.]